MYLPRGVAYYWHARTYPRLFSAVTLPSYPFRPLRPSVRAPTQLPLVALCRRRYPGLAGCPLHNAPVSVGPLGAGSTQRRDFSGRPGGWVGGWVGGWGTWRGLAGAGRAAGDYVGASVACKGCGPAGVNPEAWANLRPRADRRARSSCGAKCSTHLACVPYGTAPPHPIRPAARRADVLQVEEPRRPHARLVRASVGGWAVRACGCARAAAAVLAAAAAGARLGFGLR